MRRLSSFALILVGCSSGAFDPNTTFSSASVGDEIGSTDTVGTETGTGESSGTETSAGESGPGTSSSSESDSSSETGEPECLRQRYTFNLSNETWTALSLDQDWVGADAPPCTVTPLAATYIEGWSELLVIGDDQKFYRRVDGFWQTPQAWATSFAALNGTQPTALLHTPNPDDPSEVTLYFMVSGGQAVLYTYNEGGGAALADVVELMDDPPPAAPQGSQDMRWGFTLADTALVGDADWLVWTMNYTDDFLYRFNAAFEWVKQPQGSNDYFGTGQISEPDPSQIEVAYADLGLGRVYFVGP